MRYLNRKKIYLFLFIWCGLLIFQCDIFDKVIDNGHLDAKTRGDMFRLDGVAYPMEYANYQLNSYVPVMSGATGKLLWSRNFSEANENFLLIPRAVLIKGDHIGVLSTDNLLIYRPDGAYQHMIPLGSGTPVVFGRSAIAYLVPAYLLNYEKYSGKLILEEGEFPALREWADVMLFQPDDDEFIAAVQFTGGPRPAVLPKEYDIYRKKIEKSFVRWKYGGEGTIDSAMITNDNRKIVIIQKSKVSLFDIVNITLESGFDLAFDEIETASLDLQNNLVFIGRGAKNKGLHPYLSKCALSGKILWEYQVHNPQTHQPPVSGNDGRIYLVDRDHLECIDKTLKWKLDLKNKDNALMTVTSNNAVILLQGNQLSVVDGDGKVKFSLQITDEEESFDAPPAVDSNGRIYIASDKKLYCYE